MGSTIKLHDPTDGVDAYDTIGGDVTSLTLQTNSLSAASWTTNPTVDVPALVSTVALTVNTEGGTYDNVVIGGDDQAVGAPALVVTGAGHDSVLLANDGDSDAASTATVDFGAGSGTGDGTGLGNSLEVETRCTATLAQAPGSASHTVVVDTVTLDPVGTEPYAGFLVVSDPSTVGDLNVGSEDGAHINAASTIKSMEIGSNAVAYVDAPSTLGTVDDSGTLYVDDSSTVSALTVEGLAVTYVDSGTSTFDTVTVLGSGDLYINSGSTIGTMDVQSTGLCDISVASPITTLTVEGHVNYDESGSWLDNPSVLNTNTVGSLTISGGVLNVGTQELLVTDTDPPTVGGYVVSAYYDAGSNDWNGSGITSSSVISNNATSSNPTEAVGYASYDDGVSSLNNLGLSSGQVLVRPTLGGDATLEGTVNFSDFLRLQANYYGSGDWAGGDFNYDGAVNIGDYLILQRNYDTTYTP